LDYPLSQGEGNGERLIVGKLQITSPYSHTQLCQLADFLQEGSCSGAKVILGTLNGERN